MREGRSIRSFELRVGADWFGSSPRPIGADVLWPSRDLPSRIWRQPGGVPPPGVRRNTMGDSILRANLPRATASDRVGVIFCIGFRSSFRTKAGAAASLSRFRPPSLSPRRCANNSPLEAFSASRETAARPPANLRASIPLTAPGARKFPSASRRGALSLGP
jgi:hypothetical protein